MQGTSPACQSCPRIAASTRRSRTSRAAPRSRASVAFAPDFLSPLGGTPAEEDQALELIGRLDAAETVANAVAAVSFLEAHEATTGAVGVTGFCWGGALTNATAVPDLGAAVAW